MTRTLASTSLNIIDTFTRADNALSLGNTEINPLTWAALNSGVGGVSSNTAYSPSGGNNQPLYVDYGISDIEAQITVSTYGGGVAQQGVYFRISDNTNFWCFTHDGGQLNLKKKVAGANTNIFVALPTAIASGDVYKVKAVGNFIECYFNNKLVITTTDSFNATATKHGFGNATGNSGARFDNFFLKKANSRTFLNTTTRPVASSRSVIGSGRSLA